MMELEHLAASPFRFLMRLVRGAFIMLVLGAWTLGGFGYKLIGGEDVLNRAKAAMTLLGAKPYTFDFAKNTSATFDLFDSLGYQAHAPICSVAAWSFNTEADTGTARQSAKLAIAYQNASIMSAAMRRMFMIVKEDATYATNDGLYLTNLCEPGPDNTIILRHAPVVEMRYYKGVIAGACLKGHCNYGSDDEQSNWSSWLAMTTSYRNDDLSPHITWFDSGNLSDGQQKAVDAMNQLSTDAFWLQAAHDNGIQDDDTVLRLADRARFYRDRLMWPNGKPYSAGIK